MDVFRMVLFMGLVGVVISRSIPISAAPNDIGSLMDVGSEEGSNVTTKTNCTIDFASQNYTIITSQCIPPEYNAALCCKAFKEFACPLAAQINDVKNNNCASQMFKNIHNYGKYEPGMFSGKCRQSKLGLSCRSTTFH